MPIISVIVPVYNVESYLNRCIDSILEQSFTDFELILVDDGSPDNCPAICDEYAHKDKRVHVIHQKNGGLSAARNAGIDWVFENSNSEWITFIDSDDWVHEDYLGVLLETAVFARTSISVCSFVRTKGEIPIVEKKNPQIYTAEEFWCENRVTATIACAKLYNKECFSEIRYPVGKLHEDEFTTYRILFQENKIAVVDMPMYFYFINEQGIMSSTSFTKNYDGVEAIKQQICFFEKNNLIFPRKKSISALLWKMHVLYLESSSKKEKKWIKKLIVRSLNEYRQIITVKEFAALYEIAYPIAMRIYWKMHALKKR